MATVYARRMRDGSFEDVESLITRFRKQVEKEGILNEMKKREFYIKPSVLRYRKKRSQQHKLKLAKLRGQNDF